MEPLCRRLAAWEASVIEAAAAAITTCHATEACLPRLGWLMLFFILGFSGIDGIIGRFGHRPCLSAFFSVFCLTYRFSSAGASPSPPPAWGFCSPNAWHTEPLL